VVAAAPGMAQVKADVVDKQVKAEAKVLDLKSR
jgi:hypothetical protein